jgi:tetratricopeptide (TPR) repeat protein
MNRIFVLFTAALLSAGTAPAGNTATPANGVTLSPSANTNDAEQQELDKVMEDDDAAMDEVDQWIRDNQTFAAHSAGESGEELNRRILARLQTVRDGYQDFLKRYPTNADAYLAFGSFLNDSGDETGAFAQYEKSRELNPANPAAWNDLANYFGENGPTTNAFIYYAKAIELNPAEPVYYENLATTVYLFRKDAKTFYHLDEAQVFDKALALYQKAIQLDPDNFVLRTDYATSYYEIFPFRTHDALDAWTNALSVAHNEFEREGVYLHLARLKINYAGQFAEAQAHLDAVTNSYYDVIKSRLQRNLREREQKGTNSTAADFSTNTLISLTNHFISLTN